MRKIVLFLFLIPRITAAFSLEPSGQPVSFSWLGSSSGGGDNVDFTLQISVQDTNYGDLNIVSDLIVESFYKDKATESIWKQMYGLAELARLQKSFPYSDVGRHRMLIAVHASAASEKNEKGIVGFVDVDKRPSDPNIKDYACNPRPILSDLLVSPDMRRRGIAQKLIERCESICMEDFDRKELYIRVLEDNDAALQMYDKLGYTIIENTGDPSNVRLLKKDLTSVLTEDTGTR